MYEMLENCATHSKCARHTHTHAQTHLLRSVERVSILFIYNSKSQARGISLARLGQVQCKKVKVSSKLNIDWQAVQESVAVVVVVACFGGGCDN